jgi:hypothetical protein
MSEQDRPGLPEISAMIISTSPTHIVVAVEISRPCVARHARLLELLLDWGVTTEPPR